MSAAILRDAEQNGTVLTEQEKLFLMRFAKTVYSPKDEIPVEEFFAVLSNAPMSKWSFMLEKGFVTYVVDPHTRGRFCDAVLKTSSWQQMILYVCNCVAEQHGELTHLLIEKKKKQSTLKSDEVSPVRRLSISLSDVDAGATKTMLQAASDLEYHSHLEQMPLSSPNSSLTSSKASPDTTTKESIEESIEACSHLFALANLTFCEIFWWTLWEGVDGKSISAVDEDEIDSTLGVEDIPLYRRPDDVLRMTLCHIAEFNPLTKGTAAHCRLVIFSTLRKFISHAAQFRQVDARSACAYARLWKFFDVIFEYLLTLNPGSYRKLWIKRQEMVSKRKYNQPLTANPEPDSPKKRRFSLLALKKKLKNAFDKNPLVIDHSWWADAHLHFGQFVDMPLVTNLLKFIEQHAKSTSVADVLDTDRKTARLQQKVAQQAQETVARWKDIQSFFSSVSSIAQSSATREAEFKSIEETDIDKGALSDEKRIRDNFVTSVATQLKISTNNVEKRVRRMFRAIKISTSNELYSDHTDSSTMNSPLPTAINMLISHH
ncbi:MAG: hypothetical protein MHM6MM_003917 [Cercozoa sp. M6MM]